MTEIDYGRLDAMETAMGGRPTVARAYAKGQHLTGARMFSFPFAFDTPGLDAGVTIWTPEVGDILFDAWFEVGSIWNGATPQADFGTFVNGDGLFSWEWSAIPLDGANVADKETNGNAVGVGAQTGMVIGHTLTLDQLFTIGEAKSYVAAPGTYNPFARPRLLPLRFTAPDALKLVVSQDGTTRGGATGATQGSGVLQLLVASPQSLD